MKAIVLFLALATGLAGCEAVDKWLGCKTTTTIDEGDTSTPEGVVFAAIEAALRKDEEDGWNAFRGLLHSRQLESQASEKNWRTLNFQTFRRKAPLYLEDDTSPVYKRCYREELPGDVVKVFIANEKSEVPTPCTLKKDGKSGGAWRIDMCSL